MDIVRKVGDYMSKQMSSATTAKPSRQEIIQTFQDYLLADAENQTCIFCTQPQDTRDLIFDFLNLEDLLNISCTSKFLHSAVISFLKHECTSQGLQKAAERFSKMHADLLTPLERDATKTASQNKIDMTKCVEELTSSDRRHLWWLERERNIFRNQTKRISTVSESVGLPHKGTHYIPIREDATVGRQVCYVDNVCWLHLYTTFKDVEPGTYVCSLVLKVNRDCRMPHSGSQATEWIIKQSDIKQRTGGEFWRQLAKQRTPDAGLCDGLRVEVVDKSEADERWIAIRLPEFRVTSSDLHNNTMDVTFEMKDIDCPWWKSGLALDFVQLEKKC